MYIHTCIHIVFATCLDPSRSPVPNVTVSWSRDSKAPAGCPPDCMFLGVRFKLRQIITTTVLVIIVK